MIGGEKLLQCATETASESDRHFQPAVAGGFSINRLYFARLLEDTFLRWGPGYTEESLDRGLVSDFAVVDLLRDDVFVAQETGNGGLVLFGVRLDVSEYLTERRDWLLSVGDSHSHACKEAGGRRSSEWRSYSHGCITLAESRRLLTGVEEQGVAVGVSDGEAGALFFCGDAFLVEGSGGLSEVL